MTNHRRAASGRSRRAGGSRRADQRRGVPASELLSKARETKTSTHTQQIPLVTGASAETGRARRKDSPRRRAAEPVTEAPKRPARITDGGSGRDKGPLNMRRVQDVAVTSMSIVVVIAALVVVYHVLGLTPALILLGVTVAVTAVAVGITLYLGRGKD